MWTMHFKKLLILTKRNNNLHRQSGSRIHHDLPYADNGNVIVDRENILPFINYAPDKKSLTRQELLDKIIIDGGTNNNRVVQNILSILYGLFLAGAAIISVLLIKYW